MKPAINPPPSDAATHARYLAACLFALEPSVESLIAAATKSGWKRDYVLLAIMAIAMGDNGSTAAPAQPMHS
ncbi:hypothetical protein [Rhizobium lusitanum]|uniref:hypothetical protein n=1 Tax=Rhizobium lusitanum TaxID=293958 RepID=UPI001954C611|nr:hypothetical protein [Rhizobium lusitanum]